MSAPANTTRFLVCYANAWNARKEKRPLAGTEVAIGSVAGLPSLRDAFGPGLPLRFMPPGWIPFYWPESLGLMDDDDREDAHCVQCLPDDWRSLCWIEVENG